MKKVCAHMQSEASGIFLCKFQLLYTSAYPAWYNRVRDKSGTNWKILIQIFLGFMGGGGSSITVDIKTRHKKSHTNYFIFHRQSVF